MIKPFPHLAHNSNVGTQLVLHITTTKNEYTTRLTNSANLRVREFNLIFAVLKMQTIAAASWIKHTIYLDPVY